MKTRIISVILILAIVLPPLLLGGVLLDILIGLVIIFGGLELLQFSPNYKRIPKVVSILYMLLCSIVVTLDVAFVFASLSVLVLILLAIPIFSDIFNFVDSAIYGFTFLFMFLIVSAFTSIAHLNILYVWLALFATYLCDTGAYIVGSMIGKHKLIERISPKKTLEGAIGGVVVSFVGTMVFAFVSGIQFHQNISDVYILIFLCLTLPIVSQIGDLAFSAIKRYFKIKDFSKLFPGHGGVLDRIDSLVFSLVYLYSVLLIVL